MRTEEFLKYIKEPNLLSREHIPDLQKLVNDFPYFQAAHLLLSLASKKWDASVYQQSLKTTAIVATNRNHLYKLIHQSSEVNEEKIKQPEEKISIKENTKQELDILKSAEVVAEEKQEEQKQVEKKTIEAGIISEQVKPVFTDEDPVEQEIKKSLINAFVEKEILKTNEVFKPEQNKEQPANFSDWLQFLKKNNGQSYSDIEIEVNKERTKFAEKAKQKEKGILKDKEKKKALIDKIIETNPGSIRQKEDAKFFKSDYKAKESLVENEHLVTETLAKIYALQGNINKAIRAYEILSLKFPQKSAYFASLIQKLKNNP